ncbi:hypothetical protein MFLAVUS_008434 [Mucor flavus]|uniref:Uncharacterized protein n=1 Tax=Mucor flavus TaxID=439312 RepID=A0ABP9Z727_9FUNG
MKVLAMFQINVGKNVESKTDENSVLQAKILALEEELSFKNEQMLEEAEAENEELDVENLAFALNQSSPFSKTYNTQNNRPSPFDQALAGPTQPHNSPFVQNQSIPFAQNQSSPFAHNQSSTFSKTSNAQSNRPGPFDQSIKSITSANNSVFNLTDVKPAHFKAPIVTDTKAKVRRVSSPYARPAKASVNKHLGKAVEDKQPAPARVQPKVKELGTKPSPPPPSMPLLDEAELKRKEQLIREAIRRKEEMEKERYREAQKRALLREQREKRMTSMRLEAIRS